MSQSPSVKTAPFGVTLEGETATLYTLTNANGVSVAITDYGATVINILTPDRDGKLADIALGFTALDAYLTPAYFKENPNFGSTIGRYANRIGNGRFTLDGKSYELDRNDGPNTLHGGKGGFGKRMWKAEVPAGAAASVRFSIHSADGDQGFPGAMDASVTYTLTDGNELQMDYTAVSDQKTVANFTNHTYFNLAGEGNGTILDHEVTIPAEAFTPVSAALIPTGELQKVEGTPLDFRTPHAVGERINEIGGEPIGYDHNYVLRTAASHELALNGRAYHPKSGRVLEIYSDQPGVQFYTGNFLAGGLTGKSGKIYPQYGGLCFEPQLFPDSPNQPQFPSPVLNPGETYRARIVARFGVK